MLSWSFVVILFLFTSYIKGQGDSWDPYTSVCKPGTCGENDDKCECILIIEHRLTMLIDRGTSTTQGKPVYAEAGKLFRYGDKTNDIDPERDNVITADGYGSRIVIAVNKKFPGPNITAYEGQSMIIEVRNRMHTDSTTIHWHGMHQQKTPWSDGVAFVSQCPILPGQNFTYKFTAAPHGTSFYHAHIGDQRSMGLYGAFVIYPDRKSGIVQTDKERILLLQDWNHFDDAETLYLKMINGIFDSDKRSSRNTTKAIDGSQFSRFQFHSGLINGKGRFYTDTTNHNQAPLEIIELAKETSYRFRVISAATLYPFRVYVQGHKILRLLASDGFEMKYPTGIESFIIHPGERYDFRLDSKADPEKGTFMLIAESLEVNLQNEVHRAEAVIWYDGFEFSYPTSKVEGNPCTNNNPCMVFNCPYLYYPETSNIKCITYNDDVKTNDPSSKVSDITPTKVGDSTGSIKELFFNFAFPGLNGDTPGSVNGRQFLPPPVSALFQWNRITSKCGDECGTDKTCTCTYSVDLESNKIYQFVLTNIGQGSGYSHPVHLHGHSFYVLKMGFGTYDNKTGELLQQTSDIKCNDRHNFCNDGEWSDSSWNNGNSPGLRLEKPPQKDTIIVPSGGYVVIRFKTDNPGAWFFHCHIDLHNTNGMGMILYEGNYKGISIPPDFPLCGNFNTGPTLYSTTSALVATFMTILLLLEYIQ